MIGSCFVESMYAKLCSYKIPITYNPFGITYNPISIAHQLCSLHNNQKPKVDIISNVPYPFSHHGMYRKETLKETDDAINQTWLPAQREFCNINTYIFTLGSAYAWKRNNVIVNNCHKRPAKEFTRELLSIDTITSSLSAAFSLLPKDCIIICTVSPIRHIRDGLQENNISKSTLRMSLHELERQDSRIQYFPSFEIMTDDLRDYRFYEEDLIHPSKMAVDYIWNQFKQYAIGDPLEERQIEIQSLHKRLSHRPSHPKSAEYKRFIETTKRLLDTLQKRHPNLDWSTERKQMRKLTALYP